MGNQAQSRRRGKRVKMEKRAVRRTSKPTGGAPWTLDPRVAARGLGRSSFALLAACALAGCATDYNRNTSSDPLMGNAGRGGPAGTILGGPGQAPPPAAAIPPPATTVPSSTASLASGPAQP